MADIKRIILWSWDLPSRSAEISINDDKENHIQVSVSGDATNVEMVLSELKAFAQNFVDQADNEKKKQESIPDMGEFIGRELPL